MIKDNGKKPKGVKIEEECGKGLGILEQIRLKQVQEVPIEIKPLTLEMFEEMLELIKTWKPVQHNPKFFLVKSHLESLDDREFVFLLENYDTIGGSEAVTYAMERYDAIKKKELVISKMRRR